jgi:DNA-binding transcriptional ArsR family regulator
MKKFSYVSFFKALSNGGRLAIVESLRRGPKSVSELGRALRMEQSRVSHGLRILHEWGLVSSRREGKSVVYSIDEENLSPILDGIDAYAARYGRKLCTCGIVKGQRTCGHLAKR